MLRLDIEPLGTPLELYFTTVFDLKTALAFSPQEMHLFNEMMAWQIYISFFSLNPH